MVFRGGYKNRNLGIIIEIYNKLLHLIYMDNNEIIKKYVVSTGTKETPTPIGSFRIVQKAIWGSGIGTRWRGVNVPRVNIKKNIEQYIVSQYGFLVFLGYTAC